VAELDPVAAVLVRGPMPLSQAAKIVTRICELLAPLHDKRRAHGSICPDNVFFRHVGGELTVQLRSEETPTAMYASPERVRGRPQGPSSDVYALGILLFHMITGQPPFDADTEDEVLEQQLEKPPPPLQYNELQDIPIELEQLVRAMLAKDPARRPAVRKIHADIDNLDLDSTVMGIRIQTALDTEPTETPDLDSSLLQNVRLEHEGRTDPHLVDPYADTLIKNRAELGLDEVDGAQDTYLNLPVAQKPISGWNEDPTRIVDQRPLEAIADPATEPPPDVVPQTRPQPASSGSRVYFVLGLVFFLAAIVTAAVVLVR
jgi:serine/threonine protein kinase